MWYPFRPQAMEHLTSMLPWVIYSFLKYEPGHSSRVRVRIRVGIGDLQLAAAASQRHCEERRRHQHVCMLAQGFLIGPGSSKGKKGTVLPRVVYHVRFLNHRSILFPLVASYDPMVDFVCPASGKCNLFVSY